jgi:hypothetical protein
MLVGWFRKIVSTAFVVSTLCLLSVGGAHAQFVPRFQNEQAAQLHCPSDTVVWVNTSSGVYHFKGQRWYGNTRQGAFECRREADAEGDRATHNGQ